MKNKIFFECVECGYQSPKYYGKCPQCDSWNSMVELKSTEQELKGEREPLKPQSLDEISQKNFESIVTGFDEFDRVLGGGIVPGSVVLIGGEPGVGKSTLLLEVSGILAQNKKKVLYYSGEESASQIKLRAERLCVNSKDIFILTIGTLEDLKQSIDDIKPDFLIVDSIQTINSQKSKVMSGSISVLRFVTSQLIEIAKKNDMTVFLIGHITKEGQMAGPKTLEHMVDAVLYFQGEVQTNIRVLRAEKNRFGPLDEVGIFQMTGKGLISVKNPSEVLVKQRTSPESGISIVPVVKGLRSILIEVQALVTDSPFVGNPRRISVGFDNYRMSMLISIIEKKLKLPFYKSDVFLNITGGINIKETACDLAVLSALISSYKNITVPIDFIIIGEVGLTGEVRPVGFIENRIKEAIRQGFTTFILPSSQSDINNIKNITVHPVENLYDLFNRINL